MLQCQAVLPMSIDMHECNECKATMKSVPQPLSPRL